MSKKTLNVQLHSKDAKAPAYANSNDAGMDLFTPKKIVLKARGKVIIDT